MMNLKEHEKEELMKKNEIGLKDDYYNFLVLNINSFMGGVTDIWKNAKTTSNTQDTHSFT